jgi:hypothetical protein
MRFNPYRPNSIVTPECLKEEQMSWPLYIAM